MAAGPALGDQLNIDGVVALISSAVESSKIIIPLFRFHFLAMAPKTAAQKAAAKQLKKETKASKADAKAKAAADHCLEVQGSKCEGPSADQGPAAPGPLPFIE